MGEKGMKPEHISYEEAAALHSKDPVSVRDAYPELLEDLFLIRNPRFKFERDHAKDLAAFVEAHASGRPLEQCGSWFRFPWSGHIVHYLPDEMHQELRTARNRNLITVGEQNRLRDTVVAVAGMSVGSHCALTLNMMGMSRRMHIADPDAFSGSNMNRVRYDFTEVGRAKVDVALERMYQMDPYGEVVAFREGVTDANVGAFLDGVDILLEETDNLGMKIFLREEARKRGIPVVMATDNGDGVITDIERFDQDRNLKLFNGLIGDVTFEEFKSFPPTELPKLAAKIAGVELIVPRMLESLAEVGKTLYSWPQLGDAATLSGVVVAYAVQRIALGLPIRSGKIDVSIAKLFAPDGA